MGISPLGSNPVALLGLGTAGLDAGTAAAGATALATASAASPGVADELVTLSLGSAMLGAAAAPTGIGTYLPTLQQQASTAASAAATVQLESDASLLAPPFPPLAAGPFWSSAGATLSATTAAAGTTAASANPFDAVALNSLTAGGQELAALFAGGSPPTSAALYDVLA